MKNNTIFKRIAAYFIDIFIITLIGMAFTKLTFINPNYNKYIEVSEKYNDVLTDYYEKKINVEEFNEKTREMSYDINKTGAVFIGCDIIVIILYCGLFAFITKGQTLGKKLMGIKIVSNKNKPLKIWQYIIRCIIVNGVIMKSITLIAVCFTKSTYYSINTIGSNITMILEVTILLMVLFTSNGRGLHDIIAGTKVIDLKYEKEDEEEVKVIPPKKEKKENE